MDHVIRNSVSEKNISCCCNSCPQASRSRAFRNEGTLPMSWSIFLSASIRSWIRLWMATRGCGVTLRSRSFSSFLEDGPALKWAYPLGRTPILEELCAYASVGFLFRTAVIPVTNNNNYPYNSQLEEDHWKKKPYSIAKWIHITMTYIITPCKTRWTRFHFPWYHGNLISFSCHMRFSLFLSKAFFS